MLSAVLYTYSPSARFYDFRVAHDHYDLWIFDDFYFEEDFSKEVKTHPNTMAVKLSSLLQILDGQKCRLDRKDGTPFLKKQNVPIIVITNLPNASMCYHGNFNERSQC